MTARLIDEAPEEFAASDRTASFGFYGWEDNFAADAIQLVSYALSKIIDGDVAADPFIGDGMHNNRTSYEVCKLAEAAPVTFADSVGPLYLKVVRRVEAGDPQKNRLRADRLFTKSFEAEERWGGLLLKSLKLAAEIDPKAPARFLRLGEPNCGWAELHLLLKAIALADADGAPMFSSLIDHPLFFDADEDGDAWLPAAEAARAMKEHLSIAEWEKFEQRLAQHRPEAQAALRWYRDAKSNPNEVWPMRYAQASLQESGLVQWRVATTIGVKAFSNGFQPHLGVLTRKFSGSHSILREKTKGGFVRSPIDLDDAKRMSDAAWAKAIAKYCCNGRSRFTSDGPVGGAYQLASVLQPLVKANPMRFVNLIGTLPSPIHSVYVARLLDGLREADADDATLMRAARVAENQTDDSCEASLLSLIEAKPQIGRDQWVFNWLCNFVERGAAPSRSKDDEADAVINSLRRNDLFDHGNRISVRSYGVDRLNAALALGRVAVFVDQRAPDIRALLERRTIEEADINVLPGLAVAVGSLEKHYRSWCLMQLEALLKRDIRLVATSRAVRTFGWLLWQDRPRYEWVLKTMEASSDDAVRTLSQFWAGHLAFHDTGRWPETNALDAPARQVLAALAAGGLTSEDGAAASINTAMRLAEDENSDVVSAIFEAEWKDLFGRGGPYIDLAHRLVQSPHFPTQSNRLVLFLDDVAERFPELALAAANRLIAATAAMDEEELRQERWHYSLGKLVVGVCAGFAERGFDQSPALDLVDRFLELGVESFEHEVRALEGRR